MRVKFTLSIGYDTAVREEIMEYDEDTSEEEIQIDWENWIANFIDGGFHILKEG